MRMAKATLISIGWMLPAVAAFGASPGGVLSGVVVDGNGAPIAGALVLYQSVQRLVPAPGGHRVATGSPVASGVNTGADGSFTVSGLPPATYHLCAYGLKDTDLGSCEWGQGTATVDLASGQTARLSFQITGGAMLTFQVNDPNHRILDLADLQTANGRLPLSGANFAIGVWAGTRYARATLASTSPTTRQYRLAIPKTAVVRLFLDTSLNVADATGAAVAVRQPSVTLAPAGQTALMTNLTIP